MASGLNWHWYLGDPGSVAASVGPRLRGPSLRPRLVIYGGEAASIKVEDIMARHGAVYKKTLAYTAEQNSLIERV